MPAHARKATPVYLHLPAESCIPHLVTACAVRVQTCHFDAWPYPYTAEGGRAGPWRQARRLLVLKLDPGVRCVPSR